MPKENSVIVLSPTKRCVGSHILCTLPYHVIIMQHSSCFSWYKEEIVVQLTHTKLDINDRPSSVPIALKMSEKCYPLPQSKEDIKPFIQMLRQHLLPNETLIKQVCTDAALSTSAKVNYSNNYADSR